VLPERTVSRLHAVLRPLLDGTWEVEDLGSTNGTTVNGWRVSRPVRVRPGDILRIGPREFLLESSPAAVQ
jgi:pSer/pThr/pTyr-binding forkhead associated (FHA) protein